MFGPNNCFSYFFIPVVSFESITGGGGHFHPGEPWVFGYIVKVAALAVGASVAILQRVVVVLRSFGVGTLNGR